MVVVAGHEKVNPKSSTTVAGPGTVGTIKVPLWTSKKGLLVPQAGYPPVVNSCSRRVPVAAIASEKLIVHVPVQAGTTNPRRALIV